MAGENMESLELVRRMIELIGDDPNREGLLETPNRVVRSWEELFGGYGNECQEHAKVFEQEYDQLIVVRNLDYFSMCEHHMLPFYGQAHIAYIPNGKQVLGVSKLARFLNVFARRLQIQERLTAQVAEAIQEAVDPKGVAVVLDGTHLCMMARGVKQQHATMRTSKLTGSLKDDAKTRAEALGLMGVG